MLVDLVEVRICILLFCWANAEFREGDIRLVDGGNSSVASEGRVDIYLNGKWGTICDDGFNVFDANVICVQLGFVSVRKINTLKSYPSGQFLPIHVKSVFCIGNEKTLNECELKRSDLHKCDHHEDVTLECNTLRIIGSGSQAVGNVEVFLPHPPSFFCQDSFQKADAEQVCTTLGYSGLEDFNCCSTDHTEMMSSTKYATTECINSTTHIDCRMTNGTCSSLSYASVNCSVAPIRIVPYGGKSLDGRLEVMMNNSWGSVCSELWNNKSASVACRQLGNYALKPVNNLRCCGESGKNNNVAFNNLICIGNEKHLEQCPMTSSSSSTTYCDVGMVCTDTRLVGGRPGFPEGRVEVVTNRQWGNVCADSWTLNNAKVVCQQLYGLSAYAARDFGRGLNPVMFSKVDCVGTESSLTECSHLSHSDNSGGCSTNRHAGVVCQDLRLQSITNSSREGRVEILVDGIWGSICGHDWTVKEANIACRQLGHCSASRSGVGEHRQGVDQMHWTSVNCRGDEEAIRDCNYTTGSGTCYGFNFEADVVCVDSCPALHEIEHLIVDAPTRIQQLFKPGDKIRVRCEEKFVLVGSTDMTCLSGCKWNQEMPICLSSSLLMSEETTSSSTKFVITIASSAVVLFAIVAITVVIRLRQSSTSGNTSRNCLGCQTSRPHKTGDMKPGNIYDRCAAGTYESIGPRPIIYYQGMLQAEAPSTSTDVGYEIPNATYTTGTGNGTETGIPSFCTFVF